jgi:hypothetical protein
VLQIPNILFQTNEKYEVPLHMYETFMANIDLNPHFEYRFFNSEDRRNEINGWKNICKCTTY